MLEVILDTLRQTVVVGKTESTHQTATSESIQRLLDVLGSETLSAVEMMARLGLSHRPTFRKNYLLPARNAGVIEMTIPDKPNSRKQKYRCKSL